MEVEKPAWQERVWWGGETEQISDWAGLCDEPGEAQGEEGAQTQ